MVNLTIKMFFFSFLASLNGLSQLFQNPFQRQSFGSFSSLSNPSTTANYGQSFDFETFKTNFNVQKVQDDSSYQAQV